MPEITEEELEQLKEIDDVAELFEGWKNLRRMLNRIKAERKPQGYLEDEIEDWAKVDNEERSESRVLRKAKTDIARIFEKEIKKYKETSDRYFGKGEMIGELKSLKRRICGER